MTALEIRIRRKVFDSTGVCALRDLAFSVAGGEFLAIVGPSGAGKSTLLNIVAGLDREVDGEIAIARDGAEARIGFMFQEPRLMPWLTVADNLRLVMGKDPGATAHARRLLEQVDLVGFEDTFPGQLSGGMQRRVALARAFAIRPQVLLMDEPFLSLDAPTAARLRALLVALCEASGPTVLFVTHHLREALALADRVLFLSGRPGRVVLSHHVDLPRPRDLEDRAVGELHDRLLGEHPDLLSGLIRADEGDVRATPSALDSPS